MACAWTRTTESAGDTYLGLEASEWATQSLGLEIRGYPEGPRLGPVFEKLWRGRGTGKGRNIEVTCPR